MGIKFMNDRKKFINLFMGGIFLLFLGGCVNNPYSKVEDPAKQYLLPGFSLQAPAGKGWYLGRNDGKRVVFARKGENSTQSLIAMAVLHRLPEIKPETEEEFLKMVSAIRSRKKDPRFENILKEEKISHEKSTFTIRFRTKYKDFAAKNKPATAEYLITEDVGILWRHPENKNIGLTIGLSQRHLENEPVPDFNKIAEEFISNVHIEPF